MTFKLCGKRGRLTERSVGPVKDKLIKFLFLKLKIFELPCAIDEPNPKDEPLKKLEVLKFPLFGMNALLKSYGDDVGKAMDLVEPNIELRK